MSRPPTLHALASAVLDRARNRGVTIATAESCTGGLIAAALTAVAGSSDVFDRGFVTYSNAAKQAMLGVPSGLIEDQGAVSASVAKAMALGALKASGASLAVAVTGIAGPGGGSEHKPVGLVHLAAATSDGRVLAEERRFGSLGRGRIRQATVRAALLMGLTLLDGAETQQA